jgi:hypothetical protein
VDDYNEQPQIEFRPTIENETDVRQRRRRSSLSNRPVTRRNGGIRRIAQDFWNE